MPITKNLMNFPKIVFENSEFIVLDKPSLIHSTRSTKTENYSVADFLIENNLTSEKASPNTADAGLVNRLDFETSGILIATKNQEAWRTFRKLYNAHEIAKTYLALVSGTLEKEVVVESFLGSAARSAKKIRSFKDPKYLRNRDQSRFRFAKTTITPIYSNNDSFTIVQAKTSSGSRHQIRIHCAEMGHPLLGDTLYSVNKSLEFPTSNAIDNRDISDYLNYSIGRTRFFLHAFEAKFSFVGKNFFFKVYPDAWPKSLVKSIVI
jgi:23S rRNA-/tRNA-specific pseudouridylate synthase